MFLQKEMWDYYENNKKKYNILVLILTILLNNLQVCYQTNETNWDKLINGSTLIANNLKNLTNLDGIEKHSHYLTNIIVNNNNYLKSANVLAKFNRLVSLDLGNNSIDSIDFI